MFQMAYCSNMKTLLLILLISFKVLYGDVQKNEEEEDRYSFKYDESNFNVEIPKKHHFVLFYAPWCAHCKSLSPIWGELAEMLNEDDSNIRIARVDCTSQTKVCADQDITGYPTLKFYKTSDREGVKFRGTRDLPTLTNFINEQLRQSDEINVAIMGDNNPLKELTTDNFDDIVNAGKVFIKFYAPWCGHCQKLAPTWLALAKSMEFNEEVTIAKIDCTEHRSICVRYEVKGYPTLLWFDSGHKIDKYFGERSLEDLKKYVNKIVLLSKQVEQTVHKLKREDVVIELTSEDFIEEIRTGVTFVNFFSPWCGHCKRLAPTWESLGNKFAHNNEVKIAKVDCTLSLNREFCNTQEIDGFPALFLYKNGKKVAQYKEHWQLEELHAFVDEHVNKHDEHVDKHDEL